MTQLALPLQPEPRRFEIGPSWCSTVNGRWYLGAQSIDAGHTTTCLDCQLCRGAGRAAKSVAIFAHGQRVKWFDKSALEVPA